MNDDWLLTGLSQFHTDTLWTIDEVQRMAEIAAESMGWRPLDEGAYLHLGNDDPGVIVVVGVTESSMADENVLLLG